MRWIAGRLLGGLLVLGLVSILVFAATQALPGDVVQVILGKEATPQQIANVRLALHLDQPIWSQYLTWAGAFLRGDAGKSLIARAPVTAIVLPRLGNTLVIVIASMIISLPISVAAGLFAAERRDGIFDRGLLAFSIGVNALPEFVLGLVLVLLLSTGVLHLLPAVSLLSPERPIGDQLILLVLPTLTLVLLQITYLYRLIRLMVIDVLGTDYVEFAILKGLPNRIVLWRHVLPNAVVPAIQAAGTIFAYSLGGMIVIEYVFGFPGLGTALADAVGNRDIPVVQAIILVIATAFFLTNVVTDVIASWLTPPGRGGRA